MTTYIINIMSFKQKYTPEMVYGALEKYNNYIRPKEVAVVLGCSVRTAESLLSRMIEDKQMVRVNRGSTGANVWFYSRSEQA